MKRVGSVWDLAQCSAAMEATLSDHTRNFSKPPADWTNDERYSCGSKKRTPTGACRFVVLSRMGTAAQ
eukprot:3443142-Lingulodinium_polyedra.AAC.1